MTKLQHPRGRVIDVPEARAAFYSERGWGVVPEAPAFPDGEPTADWKADELKAYAAEHDIDLGDATKKADIVDAITAAQVPPAGTE